MIVCGWLFYALVVFFFAEPFSEIEKPNKHGVEVVANHLLPTKIKGLPSTLRIKKEFSINTEAEETAKLGLTDIVDFDVDSQGNIYLRTPQAYEFFIYKFNNLGYYLKSFGRSGQGPGELGAPSSIRVSSKDDVLISDQLNRKVVFFNSEGNLNKEIKIKWSSFFSIEAISRTNYLIRLILFDPAQESSRHSLHLCGAEFEEIKELDSIKIPIPLKADEIDIKPGRLIGAGSENNIFIGNSDRGYEISVFDWDGALRKIIRKKYEPERITQDEMKALKKMYPYNPNLKINFPKHMPAFQYFFLDEIGNLFVMTYQKEKKTRNYVYEIFNSDGIYFSKTQLGNRGEQWYPYPIIVRGSRLFCLEEKRTGYKELVVYRMTWEE